MRDRMIVAEHTVNVLAPKAYAWDEYLVERRNGQPGMTAKVAAAASACVAARTEDEFRVAYQHLSAECCVDDTPAKPSRWFGLGGA